MREIIDYEWILPGVSDGGAHTKFVTIGRYPTDFLTHIVRDEGMCSLEEAHWRLAALPAHCAGVRGRGTIVEGAPADIVAYDSRSWRAYRKRSRTISRAANGGESSAREGTAGSSSTAR
jgi:N-acyl-D-amino-acid deacylase